MNSGSENQNFQMYRVDAERHGQSLYTRYQQSVQSNGHPVNDLLSCKCVVITSCVRVLLWLHTTLMLEYIYNGRLRSGMAAYFTRSIARAAA